MERYQLIYDAINEQYNIVGAQRTFEQHKEGEWEHLTIVIGRVKADPMDKKITTISGKRSEGMGGKVLLTIQTKPGLNLYKVIDHNGKFGGTSEWLEEINLLNKVDKILR